MDAGSYDMKNAAANAVRRAPFFSEKAEVQLSDAELGELVEGVDECSPRGQVLLLVALKRCDFVCNSRVALERVRGVCGRVAESAGVLKTRAGVENSLGSGECVSVVFGY